MTEVAYTETAMDLLADLDSQVADHTTPSGSDDADDTPASA